ncbi:tetratricopeptide repeat protein 39B-like isoform X1 [Dinothrombium tinctorium]|uniref:Tetratricopeptide repeat protein 39B-like isoform X1 n=1 Tax=Dinothrombium tinctorium TaxID=1965070 RepID=A0A3S3PJ62_9ACAR|nr:tetratricopeptide repeat protein 39B-like isoform X1 [Dinothrombium tinctorium]
MEKDKVGDEHKDDEKNNSVDETMALISSVRELNELLDLFYLNKIDVGRNRLEMKPKKDFVAFYANAIFSAINALFIGEPTEISRALEDLEQLLKVCAKKRKRKSFFENLSSIWWKDDFDTFTDKKLKISSKRFCEAILNERKTWKSPELKIQFENGILNGLGTIELTMSMLPKKILKFLNLVGFSGDKASALEMLKRCADFKEGLRSRSAAVKIQGLDLYTEQITGKLQSDWENASNCALKLREEYDYSRATNEYQFAVFKMMQMEEENRIELQKVVDMSMRFVVTLKKRFPLKAIPEEKFICTRAAEYVQTGREPLIALMELFYIWSVLSLTSNVESIVNLWLEKIDKKLSELKERDKPKFNDIAVLLLAKGVLHRNKDDNEQAEKSFQTILDNEEQIENDIYVAAHAVLEIGITYLKWHKYEQAKEWLEKAKLGYEKFVNESIANLRVTAALCQLEKKLQDKNSKN